MGVTAVYIVTPQIICYIVVLKVLKMKVLINEQNVKLPSKLNLQITAPVKLKGIMQFINW